MSSDRCARCTATTARGQPCKRWAVRGSDPPRCAAHGGAAREGDAAPAAERSGPPPPERPGVPPAPKAPPGLEDLPGLGAPPGLEAQIEDLDRRIADLGAYIDQRQAELDPGDLIRLLNLHSTMVGRVSRVRAIWQQMTGGDDMEVTRAIDQARDAVSRELGVEL